MGNVTIDLNEISDKRLNPKKISCGDGAFGFMEDLSKSAGEDLVYSLALEDGNMFMCVTAFPSLTKKRFDVSDEGMRAVFYIDEDDFKLSQNEMVEKMTTLINDHIYYVDDPSVEVVVDETS
jgi:hypothetical protein